MWFPNFGQIFRDFRSKDEQRSLGNQALLKFCAFVAVVAAMLLGRRLLPAH